MLLCFAPVFAQDASADPTSDFSGMFQTFAALVAIIPFFVEAIKKLMPLASSKVIQIVSWIAGIALTMLGWYLHLGFLADLTWYHAVFYGIAASLASNGIFDIGIISGFIGLFKKK